MTSPSDCRQREHPSASQREVVERAESYVQTHLDVPVSVSHLSGVVGVSERGLRHAFQSVAGVSPKRYILTARLLAVRSALRQKGGGPSTVTDAATDFGFFELGRFATAYRQIFGERPSDTLRRKSGKRAN